MRKEFNKILKIIFAEKLSQHVADFLPLKVRSPFGFQIFCKRMELSGISFFIILVPDANREAFTVELGWTDQIIFPDCPKRGWPTTSRIEFASPEFVCRLGNLFGHDDYWWVIRQDLNPLTDDPLEFIKATVRSISAKDAAAMVEPLVDDAMEQLCKFGLPYMSECAAAKGLGETWIGGARE